MSPIDVATAPGYPPADRRRWAWATIDLDAVRHNVGVLRAAASPAEVWAVVKADGYGHGAVAVARAALGAGCTALCVALVQEAAELRAEGITAPILVLAEPPPAQLAEAAGLDVALTVYRAETIQALARLGTKDRPLRVHLKVDTGMHRAGCPPEQAASLASLVAGAPGLRLAGTLTHLARADEPGEATNATQLARFDEALAALAAVGIDPGVVHAANSAGLLALPGARRQAVRAGIAVYGIVPGPGVAHLSAALRPVLSLRARVAHVLHVAAGEGVSYGHRFVTSAPTTLATLPLGYADGVPRRLSGVGGEVLLRGHRCRIAGVVTMDQMMLDVGSVPVDVGDEAVLLGRQGGEEITATEWADRLGTIAYEVTCGISPRVPRHVLHP